MYTTLLFSYIDCKLSLTHSSSLSLSNLTLNSLRFFFLSYTTQHNIRPCNLSLKCLRVRRDFMLYMRSTHTHTISQRNAIALFYGRRLYNWNEISLLSLYLSLFELNFANTLWWKWFWQMYRCMRVYSLSFTLSRTQYTS